MRRLCLTLYLTSILLAAPAPFQAQTTPAPSFEVASLRIAPTRKDAVTSWSPFNSNRFTATNTSLKLLIALAYEIDDHRIEGDPSWLAETFYDITAKAEGDTPLNYQQMKPLLQHLLEQRLHLAVHRSSRQLPGYALRVLKSPLPLTPAPPLGNAAHNYILTNEIHSESASLASLAFLLSRPLGKPVKDETEVRGTYKLSLNFAPADSSDSPLPSIFTAVQQQLGLKLDPTQVPVEFVIIDHVDRVPTEN